jgi:hypothetical protein
MGGAAAREALGCGRQGQVSESVRSRLPHEIQGRCFGPGRSARRVSGARKLPGLRPDMGTAEQDDMARHVTPAEQRDRGPTNLARHAKKANFVGKRSFAALTAFTNRHC